MAAPNIPPLTPPNKKPTANPAVPNSVTLAKRSLPVIFLTCSANSSASRTPIRAGIPRFIIPATNPEANGIRFPMSKTLLNPPAPLPSLLSSF